MPHKILVIEDNKAVRISIIELMNMFGYECTGAEHGAEGLELAIEVNPDIILCDVNMPIMDGNAFTEAAKAHSKLSHIPIIMLTANVAVDDKIAGLDAGAVDYINKPFNSKELALKIRNILSTREQLEKKSWRSVFQDSFEPLPNLDEEFIQQLYNKISENIDNTSYTVKELSIDLSVSERNLYRKVKESIDMPVATFIREIKLQRAHELLENKRVRTFTELAHKVGFKSPTHLSTLYKKRFPNAS